MGAVKRDKFKSFKKGLSRKSLGFIMLFIITVSAVWGKPDFPQINAAYKYDPYAVVQCKYVLAADEDSVHIYLQIEVKEGELKDYTIGYELKDTYEGKSYVAIDSLNLDDFLLLKENQTYYLKMPIKAVSAFGLMVFSIKSPYSSFHYDISFDTEGDFALSNLVLMENDKDVPVFNSYISTESSFRVVNSFNVHDTSNLYFYQYKHDFSPALPPMAGRPDQVDKTLTIDSVFSLSSSSTIRLGQNALYFIQRDTTTLRGIAFRTVENYYPKYGKAEELIGPLIYISTRNEMSKLSEANDLKQALDKYWLELIKTPSRAKSVIKSFYNQVEAANATFTTYKEGWKTDQGMIYTLYGVPDEVYFNGKEEQWIYKKNDGISRVKFTFVKIKNIFTDRHFELLRSKSYESFWFGNVELWRKGIKGL